VAELRVDVCDPSRHLHDAAEHERLFTPSYSNNYSNSGADAGAGAVSALDGCGSSSGLGLFVARRVARAMGGDVAAEEAQAGAGACGTCGGAVLRVRLPVRLLAPGAAAAAAAAAAGASDDAATLPPSKRPHAAASGPPPPGGTHALKQPHVDPATAPAAAALAAALRPRCLLVDDHEVRCASCIDAARS
jgi:hypothetical protein